MMPVIRGLLISLSVHLLLSWLLMQVPQSWTRPSSVKTSQVKVQLIDKPASKDERQVVRDTSIPEAQKSLDDALARFLSAKRQRVVLETQAKNSGMTKNRSEYKFETPPKKTAQSGKDITGYKPVDFSKALQDKGESTVGEALPTDLAVGSFTALNTDQYQFYSFYSRVEELVRFRWETRVRDALEIFDRRRLLDRLGNRNWVTQAVFVLDKHGKLQKVLVMKESGITSFDQAAIGAFQEVMLFPNPPDEMVEDDGLIRLKYSFNVHFNPNVMATR